MPVRTSATSSPRDAAAFSGDSYSYSEGFAFDLTAASSQHFSGHLAYPFEHTHCLFTHSGVLLSHCSTQDCESAPAQHQTRAIQQMLVTQPGFQAQHHAGHHHVNVAGVPTCPRPEEDGRGKADLDLGRGVEAAFILDFI
eukprot:2347901-Rhodomonas_salina.2